MISDGGVFEEGVCFDRDVSCLSNCEFSNNSEIDEAFFLDGVEGSVVFIHGSSGECVLRGAVRLRSCRPVVVCDALQQRFVLRISSE